MDAAPVEVKDPVNSTSVPTLILQGAYDMPTPVYMGRRAHRELQGSSTYVLVPQEGHGTWKNAYGCVGQIASGFVQDPAAQVNRSCLEARRPQWVLSTEVPAETPSSSNGETMSPSATVSAAMSLSALSILVALHHG